MIKIILNIVILFSIVACGNNSDTKTITNAHKESFELLRWSSNELPLVIKIPVEAYNNTAFINALENAANTWNTEVRSVIGKDAFVIQSFGNNISSQSDLENSLLSIKCNSEYNSYCQGCGEDQDCTNYCNQYSKNDCHLSIANNQFKPLTILDYLKDGHMVVSNPLDWFEEASDLTIAITGYTYDVNSNRIINADIIFNEEFYNFAYTDPVFVTQIDFESSLLHELGHFLGLKHINKDDDPNSIMNPSLSKGQIKRTLSEQDKATIRSLYRSNLN